METNGVIQQTLLNATAFQIVCGVVVNEQSGTAVFALELNTDNIQQVLDIANKEVWEQLVGSPIRIRLGQDGEGKPKLEAVGHFLANKWLTIPDEAPVWEEEQENDVQT
jgi:hypothetical protein